MQRMLFLFLAILVTMVNPDYALAGQPRKLNGGLEATVVSVGRDKDAQYLSITLSLRNAGTKIAHLTLIGPTSATDSAGGYYNYQGAAGISICPWHGATGQCMQAFINSPSDYVRRLVQMDPGTDLVITFRLRGSSQTSRGGTIDFTSVLAARFVTDPLQDSAMRDDLKGQEVRQMNLSFIGEPVTDAR